MDYIFFSVGFCLVVALFASIAILSQDSLWDRNFSPDIERILEDSLHGTMQSPGRNEAIPSTKVT